MEVEIRYHRDDREVTERISHSIEDKTKTLGDLRKEFALKNGLYDERFRFIKSDDGTILHDTDTLKSLLDQAPLVNSNSNSEADLGEMPEDEGESAVQEPDPGVVEEEDAVEKGSYDSSEEEKNSAVRKTDKILELIDKHMSGGRDVRRNFDHVKAREEILTVMRMSREQIRKAEREQVAKRVLRVRVEEGYPVFLYSKNDGVKYLACQATDTIGMTKKRFAKLFNCPVKDFRIRKADEDNDLEDETITLEEIGMDEGRCFDAWRVGSQNVLTIYGFSVCLKLKVDFTKSIEELKEMVVLYAPDLRGIKLRLWYNGMFLPNEENVKSEDRTPVGRIFLGSNYLRVLIEYDSTLPLSLDKGPDMIVKRPPRDKPTVIKMRRKADGSGYYAVREDGDNDDPYNQYINGKRVLRLIVNKRALRPFSLLIECHLVENVLSPLENGAEYESPITLDCVLPSMRLHELREEIASHSKEQWQHQILFWGDNILSPSDDHKTLREIGICEGVVLFKEPCINVTIDDGRDTHDIRVAGSSTTFGRLAKLIEKVGVFKLSKEQIRFKHGNILALPECPFSDYKVRAGDTIHLIRPIRVRVWQKCYAHDKDFYPDDDPFQLLKWVSDTTEIAKDSLVISWILGDMIRLNKATLEDCGFNQNKWEIQAFEKDNLPERLKQKSDVSKYPGFIHSTESDDDSHHNDDDEDDEDDEDDPKYQEDD